MVCDSFPKTLTLPYLLPKKKFVTLVKTLLQAGVIISSPVQTDVKGLVKGVFERLIDNDDIVACSNAKKHTFLKTRMPNAIYHR